jgi:hypothetical protein
LFSAFVSLPPGKARLRRRLVLALGEHDDPPPERGFAAREAHFDRNDGSGETAAGSANV